MPLLLLELVEPLEIPELPVVGRFFGSGLADGILRRERCREASVLLFDEGVDNFNRLA